MEKEYIDKIIAVLVICSVLFFIALLGILVVLFILFLAGILPFVVLNEFGVWQLSTYNILKIIAIGSLLFTMPYSIIYIRRLIKKSE